MLVLRLLALPLLACRGVSPVEPPKVTWTDLLPEPGKNQAGQETFANSLPIGNGDMSALVSLASSNATDSATDVNVLLTLQSAWDELAAPYKVGLVTVTHKAPLSSMSSFSLDTSTGTTTVSFDNGETLTIFVDAAVNVLSVVSSASTPLSFSISNMRTSSESTIGPFGDCDNQTRSADVTTGDTFYHENNPDATYVATTLSRLNLDSIKDETWDPITGRASGGQVWSSANGTTVSIAALTSTSGAASLLSDLATLAASYTLDKAASDAVWEEFWSRSFISVTSATDADSAAAVTRQLQLNRYLQRLQTGTENPIKFNGQSFTATRPPLQDVRDWGGHNWWQNVRLQYYNMLPAGDFDAIKTSLFDAYKKMLPYTRAKTAAYWPEFSSTRAASFDEYTSLFGSNHATSYAGSDCSERTDDMPDAHAMDVWNGLNWQGGLDLANLMLDYFAHTLDADFLNDSMDLIAGQLDFYEQLFGGGDLTTTVNVFPSQSIETFQCPGYPADPANCATNDLPTVAGLRLVLERVLDLIDAGDIAPESLGDTDAERWTQFFSRLPAIPTRTTDDGIVKLAPCELCPDHTNNVENPELYATHPYQIYTVAGAANNDAVDLDLAINAYKTVAYPGDEGWNQMSMDAALLGLAQDARKLVTARATAGSAQGYRFEAFMEHEFDYEPSSDHMANMVNALDYMLMQTNPVDGKVSMFPAWPCDWDVEFKLHAAGGGVVEGKLEGGELAEWKVDGGEGGEDRFTVMKCQ